MIPKTDVNLLFLYKELTEEFIKGAGKFYFMCYSRMVSCFIQYGFI